MTTTVPDLPVYPHSLQIGCEVALNYSTEPGWFRVVAMNGLFLTVVDAEWDVPNPAKSVIHRGGVRQVRGGTFDYPAIHAATLAALAVFEARTGYPRAATACREMIETIESRDAYFIWEHKGWTAWEKDGAVIVVRHDGQVLADLQLHLDDAVTFVINNADAAAAHADKVGA